MFNWIKTAALMAAITALFGVIGASIGGKNGMIMALGFAVVSNFFAYWFSDKMVLKMYRAREVDASSAPQFYQTVQELAQRAGLPMPRVYLIDEDAPNAFATGRNPQNAAVAATTGLLRMLNAREVRGVMAHELAHVKHRDILISTISATMAGAISALANFAMFFGGRDEEGAPPTPSPRLPWPSWRRWPPRSSRWPSRGRVNSRPTGWAPRSQATRVRWPRRWRRSSTMRRAFRCILRRHIPRLHR